MTHVTHSAQETQELAQDFAEKLKGGERIALVGSLGAGKTTFVQGMATGLKIDPQYYVNSPTYTIICEYESTNNKRLVHMDLYRITTYDEVIDLGYEEEMEPGSILVVEWADKFPEMAPIFDFQVILTALEGEARKICIERT